MASKWSAALTARWHSSTLTAETLRGELYCCSEKKNLRALLQGVLQLTASAAIPCLGVLHLHNALQWTIFLNEAIKPLQRPSSHCYRSHLLTRWEFQGKETQWRWLKLALPITLESLWEKNFKLAASVSVLPPFWLPVFLSQMYENQHQLTQRDETALASSWLKESTLDVIFKVLTVTKNTSNSGDQVSCWQLVINAILPLPHGLRRILHV